MTLDAQSQGRAQQEAAQWFARLSSSTISTQELTDFRAWRRAPENDAAYAAVEKVWRTTGAMAEDPDVALALKDAQSRNVRGRRRWPLWTWLAPLGAAGLAGLAGVGLYVANAPSARTYQTAIGEQRLVTLEDGTRVKLDTDSEIAVRFTRLERQIQLTRGQALFDVIHNRDRPLVVAVGETVIRDLGTRFDVRRDLAAVRVTVLEGRVEVGSRLPGAKLTLTPGQQGISDGPLLKSSSVDAVKAAGWTSGRLVFDGMPLSAAVAEMSRYSRHPLVLDAPDLGDTKVNGAFDSTDTPAFVSAVTRLYDLKADAQPNGTIRLSRTTLDRGR